MMTALYGTALLISMALLLYMAHKNYENIDIHYWTYMVLIPLVVLGYALKTVVLTPDAARITFCYIYLDSTVILVIVIFSMLRLLDVHVKPWIKVLSYMLSFAHCLVIWTTVNTTLYYDSLLLIPTDYGIATKMTSGPLKIIHYIYLAICSLAILSILIYGYTKKKTYSHRMLSIYSAVVLVGAVVYSAETLADIDFSLLPFFYVAAEVLIVVDYDHVHSYDISCLVSEQQKYHSTKGYVAFDNRKRFLSCNAMAFSYVPNLKYHRVDTPVSEERPLMYDLFNRLIDDYVERGVDSRTYEHDDRVCKCEISRFSMHKDGPAKGYLFTISDVTEEQRVLHVMESYNETLNTEVQEKTENIKSIQEKVVLGLANMVENRDNNTGGHVKRTSDVIKYLVDEIVKQGAYEISEEKAIDIVRSAPMHDLGKIAVDNSILCKPGRLTDEEYAIMKTHSPKSGEIVKLILEGVEEQHFVDTAFNVARFHHERWDGRGYPEGLVGEMTPLEARIMAVADVYDALVSKRCYKEPMSFEKAYDIMCEGMGSQFDPSMLPIFVACREKLEAYYTANNA